MAFELSDRVDALAVKLELGKSTGICAAGDELRTPYVGVLVRIAETTLVVASESSI